MGKVETKLVVKEARQPNLNTILMVEDFLKKHNQNPRKVIK